MVEGETFGGRVLPATLKIAAMATSLIMLSGCYAAVLRIDEGNIPDTVNSVASASEASEALGKLEVAPPDSVAGYSRERFPHWSDAEEFGWVAPSPRAASATPR